MRAGLIIIYHQIFNQPSKDALVVKVRWPLVPSHRILTNIIMTKWLFQSGGNLTSILGSLVSYVGGPDIVDGTGWPWTMEWHHTGGTGGQNLSISTAYYMRSDSPQTSSVGSSCLWECKFLRERYCTLLNLSQYLFIDLHKQSWLFRKLVAPQYLCLI